MPGPRPLGGGSDQRFPARSAWLVGAGAALTGGGIAVLVFVVVAVPRDGARGSIGGAWSNGRGPLRVVHGLGGVAARGQRPHEEQGAEEDGGPARRAGSCLHGERLPRNRPATPG